MLTGKVAVVTGAGRGIGRAIALKLSKLGASVVINYRSSIKEAQELIDEIKSNGGNAEAVQGDVSSLEDAEKVIKFAVEKFGRLDILVNNAGITKDTLLLRMKEEDFDKVLEVNLKGVFNCTKHASAIMLKQKSGRIINISSVIGLIGNAGQANYAAAKAGIIGFTKSIAKELGGRGITVNAIAPGFISTDMTEVLSDKVKEKLLENVPLRKLGSPEDVANLAGFLASDNASYITGQVINVDGGMVM
ncbi:3-oxoacyl-[acyl-carrier-protein] reductase [Clostridium sp. YIM B02515]|uniref:3-oxoacyl-[acyl-carrier-protein] reductase n=1 Tax=Clostridium rhizosphaerae TaxID=2803861 RepID=A0ABS1TH50_9CLOT|nr:3-oxoacyl-[acyl-carrier-protein] reductase [Clostridium rhizosphaerae]MBL4937669.1 3-oxoacyl-[acyl-carrier-protein] reductase [Clostridium rhizosphaerae]